jgi:hypothetical protein
MPQSDSRKWNGTEATNQESDGFIPLGNGDGTSTWVDPASAGLGTTNAVILAPGTTGRNTIQPTADVDALILREKASGFTSTLLKIVNAAGTIIGWIWPTASPVFSISSSGTSIRGLTTTGIGTSGEATGSGGVGLDGSSVAGASGRFRSANFSNTEATVIIQRRSTSTAELLSVRSDAGASVAGFDKDGNVFAPNIGGGGVGTVTSVALTVPSEFSVAGSPVTTSGTLAVTKANQSANTVFAGPTSGGAAAPAFRALVSADIPNNAANTTGTASNVTSTVAAANGGTGQTTYTKGDLLTAPGGASLNKLAVGTDGQVLTADAASTNGVKWAAAAGGSETVNIETITATRTLTVGTDSTYQVLLPSGATRIVNMIVTGPPATGSKFTIRNASVTDAVRDLTVQSGGTQIDTISRGAKKTYIFDGTNWVGYSIGAGEGTSDIGTVLGRRANIAFAAAVAIGDRSSATADTSTAVGALSFAGSTSATAIGASASSSGGTQGTAIGASSVTSAADAVAVGTASSVSAAKGVALGRSASVTAVGGIAKGFSITVSRAFEESAGASAAANNARYSDFPYSAQTTNATATEIFLGATASNRLTIAAGRAIGFRMNVVAYSTTDTIGRVWRIEGGIKNVGGTTSLIGTVSKTSIADDGADSLNWDVTVTADDTNDSLKIAVTGSTSKTINWTVRVDAVETQ